MFNVSNTPHVLDALKSCEIGNQVPLKNLRNHLRNDYVIRNINENNYSETILEGHTSKIVALDVQGYFLATASNDDTIKLWNLDTGKCLWTFNSELPIDSDQNLKIVKGDIVCSGRGEREDSLYPYIQIIDLNTGQKITSIRDSELDIRDSKREPARKCMIGRRIFAILKKENKKYVGEWDINGRFQRTFSKIKVKCKCKIPTRTNLLLGSENFLVHIYYNILKIHDLQSGNDGKIELEHYNKDIELVVKSRIASAYIKDQRLICGSVDGNGIPNCYVIDLKTEKGTPYTINKFSLLIKDLPPYIDRIEKIILHREWAYLGLVSGHLVAINLEEKKIIPLGRHEYISYLALEEQLLISGSFLDLKFKFWNIKSLKQVGEVGCPYYTEDMAFVSGKLLMAVGNSLKTCNYFIPSIKK